MYPYVSVFSAVIKNLTQKQRKFEMVTEVDKFSLLIVFIKINTFFRIKVCQIFLIPVPFQFLTYSPKILLRKTSKYMVTEVNTKFVHLAPRSFDGMINLMKFLLVQYT